MMAADFHCPGSDKPPVARTGNLGTCSGCGSKRSMKAGDLLPLHQANRRKPHPITAIRALCQETLEGRNRCCKDLPEFAEHILSFIDRTPAAEDEE